ncbi:helix-turn-helix domain-containing protein [Desulfosporosinus sp.]|uniref:PucR family transcriptional regulator n=1 Tax=Desulfosporosinus sp. TaxID=157907 RepID=UPI0025BFE405|nr:helix-turn-helix domain-containing protein [Desulfosporosinus sp.]MBC2721440.1 helix-turn-helix domain-containing protein [Desulfosporosinus sp.]MBC2727496.1 helix-turn-helix domain-containing protein [Desulfosporosinus sp.]
MDNLDLPQSITVGRLQEALSLQAIGSNNTLTQSISQLSIQTILFSGINTFSLPLVGETIILEPTANGSISLTVEVSNQKITLFFSQENPSPWPIICDKASDWLERELGRVLMTSERYTQMIAEHLTRGKGFSFLASLQEIFGCDIFLINKQLEVLGWAGGKTVPLVPISFKPPRISPNLPKPFAPLYTGQWADKKLRPVPLTWCPLSGPKGVLGFLGLAEDIQNIGSIKQFFLHKTTTLILLELVKTQSIQDSERQHHRDFLFDLLYNNFDSLEVIISRGKLWGWDFSKPHFVVVGEITGYDPDSADRERFEELLTEMTTLLHKRQPKTICLERNGQVVLLFPLQDMLPQSEWHSKALGLLEPILKIINSIPGKQPFQYGLGNLYNSARYLHRSFQEARTALELGKLFDKPDRLIPFYDLGIMRLLHRLDRQELEDYRSEILGPLLKFDKESNLSLEETLLAYFSCNTDLNAAGEKLYLHPNTLRYRLKKASEILDRDLSSLENQVNLFLALKIGRIKSLWPD